MDVEVGRDEVELVEVVEGDFAFRRSDAGEEGPMALVVHRA